MGHVTGEILECMLAQDKIFRYLFFQILWVMYEIGDLCLHALGKISHFLDAGNRSS